MKLGWIFFPEWTPLHSSAQGNVVDLRTSPKTSAWKHNFKLLAEPSRLHVHRTGVLLPGEREPGIRLAARPSRPLQFHSVMFHVHWCFAFPKLSFEILLVHWKIERNKMQARGDNDYGTEEILFRNKEGKSHIWEILCKRDNKGMVLEKQAKLM